VLSRVFRGKFVAALKNAFREARIEFHGRLAPLAKPRTFASWLRLLFRQDWVVYAKPPFGGPEHVLRYLGGLYPPRRHLQTTGWLLSPTKRHLPLERLRSRNKKRLMTLPVEEFLRRFLLHLLPRGFRAHPQLRLPR